MDDLSSLVTFGPVKTCTPLTRHNPTRFLMLPKRMYVIMLAAHPHVLVAFQDGSQPFDCHTALDQELATWTRCCGCFSDDCPCPPVQGNGTAAIFQNEPRVVTFDMHGMSHPGCCPHGLCSAYTRFEKKILP